MCTSADLARLVTSCAQSVRHVLWAMLLATGVLGAESHHETHPAGGVEAPGPAARNSVMRDPLPCSPRKAV